MKSRFLTTLLTTLLSLSVAQAQVFDFTYKGQTLKYEVTAEKKVCVSSQNNELSGDVKIPSEVEFEKKKYKVTSIGKEAFNNCLSLQSVVIPNSVKNIGDAVFMNCYELQKVTIPNSLKFVGDGIFDSCDKLKKENIIMTE